MLILLAALALQPATPSAASGITVSEQAPDPQADQAVRAATRDFLDAKDQGRFEAAYAMPSGAQQTRRPRAAWDEAVRDFNSRAGQSRGRQISGVSWLHDPARPYPYGVVEYNGDYVDLVFMCGVVIWERQPDGSWRVFREVLNAASRADAPNATPEQIAAGRRQYHCRD